jgi:hypothetical protein
MTNKLMFALFSLILSAQTSYGAPLASCVSGTDNGIQFNVGIFSQGNGTLRSRIVESYQGQRKLYQDYQVRGTQSKVPTLTQLELYQGESFELVINRNFPILKGPQNTYAALLNAVFVAGHTSLRGLKLQCHLNESPSFGSDETVSEIDNTPPNGCCFQNVPGCTGRPYHCK